jgi:hypothetical protein
MDSESITRLSVPPPFTPPDIVFYTSLAMQTTPTFHIGYEVDLRGPILKVCWVDYSVSGITYLYLFIQLPETVFSIAVHGSYHVWYRIVFLYIFSICALRNIQRQYILSPSSSFLYICIVKAVCYFSIIVDALRRWKNNSKKSLKGTTMEMQSLLTSSVTGSEADVLDKNSGKLAVYMQCNTFIYLLRVSEYS